MNINGKQFRPFIGKAELSETLDRLAAELNRDYGDSDLVVCPILTGAFMFATDLLRRLTVPCEVSFVRYASYDGMSSTGSVRCVLPFPASIQGRNVLVVEDVVDSGLTTQVVLEDALRLHPRSAKVCTLFYKPDAFRGNYTVHYAGRNIGNEFIVGYGMDYDEKGRNLPEVFVLDE